MQEEHLLSVQYSSHDLINSVVIDISCVRSTSIQEELLISIQYSCHYWIDSVVIEISCFGYNRFKKSLCSQSSILVAIGWTLHSLV